MNQPIMEVQSMHSHPHYHSFLLSLGHKHWIWVLMGMLSLTLLSGVILYRIFNYLMNRIKPKGERSHQFAILKATSMPVVLAVLIFGLVQSIHFFGLHYFSVTEQAWLDTLMDLIFLGLSWWASHRYITHHETRLIMKMESSNAPNIDKTTLQALLQLWRVALFITVILVGMQILGMPMSGILAFGSIGGFGFAFAAKDLLANFFGGLVVFLDRPFEVGDWICSPDRTIEGTVEMIGWRVTKIITFERRPVYIPNSVFLTVVLENPSRMTHRRIRTTLGVRYQDAKVVAPLVHAIEEMLKKHPDIDPEGILFVKLNAFGPHALELLIQTYTKATGLMDFQAVKQDVFLKILALVEEHGAECALPTRHLYHFDSKESDAPHIEADAS